MIRSRKISFSLLIFRLLVVVKSISKCVVNEDHVDSVSVSGESGIRNWQQIVSMDLQSKHLGYSRYKFCLCVSKYS